MFDEKTGNYIGGPVHEVTLSRAWYGEWMGKYISLFEDGFIAMPRDASLEDDHRAVEFIDGIPMVPKLERKDLKDADLVRHGDGAVAGALMNFAALNPVNEWLAEYMEVPRRDAQVDEMDTDTDLEYGGRMAGW